MGAAALLVPSACPKGHSPSHLGLDPVWAAAQEAGIPVVFHVGGGGDYFDHDYFLNGLPIPPDFHGGEENFRSVDYMGIPGPPMLTMATMIFDGVLDRFPRLQARRHRAGRDLDAELDAPDGVGVRRVRPSRGAPAAPCSCARPSTCSVRSGRRPYPTEDVGWITEQVGPDICLFSSDYPHVEGGRKPIERFEALAGRRVATPSASASTATTSST